MRALAFAGLVLAVVIPVRFACVMAYGLVIRLFRRYFEKRTGRDGVPGVRVGILVSTMSTTISRMNWTTSS